VDVDDRHDDVYGEPGGVEARVAPTALARRWRGMDPGGAAGGDDQVLQNTSVVTQEGIHAGKL